MNATGHMVVARIAWNNLNPVARSTVERLNSVTENPGAGVPTSAQDNTVDTAATWMDDVRPAYKELHFVNTPVDGDGTLPPGENSVTFFQKNLTVLHDPNASEPQKAESLRCIEHLMGDTHQPLHDADNHDRGGNLFHLDGRNNLHELWDSGGNQWKNVQRPLTDAGRAQIAELAAKISAQFPETSVHAQAVDLSPEHWVHEGWEMARSDVYTGVTQGQAAPAAYVQRAQLDMNREAAVAGYRLANLLNGLYPAA